MQDDLEIRRKRLRFRANHRGTKELDIYVGGFADSSLADLNAGQLDKFEAILESDEVSIFHWISGREAVPSEHDHDIMALFLAYRPPAGTN